MMRVLLLSLAACGAADPPISSGGWAMTITDEQGHTATLPASLSLGIDPCLHDQYRFEVAGQTTCATWDGELRVGRLEVPYVWLEPMSLRGDAYRLTGETYVHGSEVLRADVVLSLAH